MMARRLCRVRCLLARALILPPAGGCRIHVSWPRMRVRAIRICPSGDRWQFNRYREEHAVAVSGPLRANNADALMWHFWHGRELRCSLWFGCRPAVSRLS